MDSYVAWASVEVIDPTHSTILLGGRGDEADIGNTTNVLTGTGNGRMLKEQPVEESNHGGTLTSNSLLRDSEVGDCGLSKSSSKDSALSHSQCRLGLPVSWHTQQPDGLTVGCNNIDVLLEVEIVTAAELLNGISEDLAKLHIDLAELLGSGRVLSDDAEHRLLDRLWEFNIVVLKNLKMERRVWSFLSEMAEDAVNAIHGGTRVQSENTEGEGLIGGCAVGSHCEYSVLGVGY